MKLHHLLLAVAISIGMLAGVGRADSRDTPEQADIRQLLVATFDKPEARLSVDPIVVEQDAGVAGWTQGEMGGRALLRRRDGLWVLVMCAGDALKSAATLEQAGLAAAQAGALATAVAAAEVGIDANRREMLARFDGIMMMEGSHDGQTAGAP